MTGFYVKCHTGLKWAKIMHYNKMETSDYSRKFLFLVLVLASIDGTHVLYSLIVQFYSIY